MKRSARSLLGIGLMIVVVAPLVRPALHRAWFVYRLATEPAPAHLRNPVLTPHPIRITNSWGNPRSGGRHHEGIDIFAPKGTPVVSTTAGIVTHVGTNTLGGRVVTVLGPAFESHYYAHLDSYGEFRDGDLVQPGDVIGYVGNSGNARGGPPHLHYGIYQHGAKNPYVRLVGPVVRRPAKRQAVS
jgi:murein DD-endopeptidase MepM/ murein hydrolase activator NlpD